jgi:hypothetical protein
MPQHSPRNHRNNPYTMDRMFAQVHHSAAGAIFRFRTELALLLAAIAGMAELAKAITTGWAVIILTTLAVAVMVVPYPGGW